jgi:hypothetical protein
LPGAYHRFAPDRVFASVIPSDIDIDRSLRP